MSLAAGCYYHPDAHLTGTTEGRLTRRRKANATVQCPVKEGKYDVVQKVELPKEIPKGELGVGRLVSVRS